MMTDLISREEAISALCHTMMPITAIRELPAVDAIPVGWLWAAQDKMLENPRYSFSECAIVGSLINMWQKEQEAQDG